MDVQIDQSVPRNDMIKEEDGKYIYRIDENRDEVDRFNRDFEQYKERRKKMMKIKLDEKLDRLNQPPEELPLYNQPVGSILIQTKDAWLNLLDDLLQFRFTLDTFTKENRLFHIGLTIVFVAIFMYVYSTIMSLGARRPDPRIVVEVSGVQVREN